MYKFILKNNCDSYKLIASVKKNNLPVILISDNENTYPDIFLAMV